MNSVGAQVLEVKLFFLETFTDFCGKYATRKALSTAAALLHVSANQRRLQVRSLVTYHPI